MTKMGHRHLLCVAALGFAGVSCVPFALAGPEESDSVDKTMLDRWRTTVEHNVKPPEGCGRITYPNYVWERVKCETVAPRSHPVHRKPRAGEEETVGDGNDYIARSAGLTTKAVGSFPRVIGITSEQSDPVAAFGGGGILGPNEYTLQINTNDTGTTGACAGHVGCTVWQQFIYATDYLTAGQGAIFIEYWLIGWGSSPCPSGWNTAGSDCWVNSAYTTTPDIPASSLGSLTLTATAPAGGNDTVVLTNGTQSYSFSALDSVLDISSVWHDTEFNVVGDAGGSIADFNTGVTLGVQLVLTDGSTAAPSCVPSAGTTGETNNLNLGSCAATSGSSPGIQFIEFNGASPATEALNPSILMLLLQ